MVAWIIIGAVVLAILWIVVAGQLQREHAIRRNYPLLGNMRYWLEAFGPELRQYIVTANDEGRPFDRNQRRWVYSSAKRQNNQFGFGSDAHTERSPGYLIIKPAAFPHRPENPRFKDPELPCGKVLGQASGRSKAFRPASVVNVSGMSFGSLGGRAIEAMNEGCAAAGCLQNTGEGGLSVHHMRGGELIFQVGTGYFGCRDDAGRFDLARLTALVEAHPVRAIEIKLSQGAKPGLGGLVPAAKVTAQVAEARGVPIGQDIVSPSAHSAFSEVDTMLEFIERLADRTGLPVGIKAAVGETRFWDELCLRIAQTGRQPDFVTIDGGEGGTGAAPLVYADHVALPFFHAQSRVHAIFARHGVSDRIVFVGSGKLGFPESALLGFALGLDMVNVGREAMMAVGCIQAQRCHTGRCPTGVATHSPWRQRGLDVPSKALRLSSYIAALRRELLSVTHTCGNVHPSLVTTDHFEILQGNMAISAIEVYGYEPAWGLPGEQIQKEITELMKPLRERQAAP
ncbi:MAG: FMN-binding glutamate synthase family protein [Thermoleophilia bacterium]|nr:FMN-binding glutamate synthase family protein [Thermoleophilia bacterium]